MGSFERIVFATDFSEASGRAFDQAVRLAKEFGSALTIVHVCQVWPIASLAYSPASAYEEYEKALRTAAEGRLEELVAAARARGADAHPALAVGFPDEEIVAAAERERANLIVLGTHGRRGAGHFFLGSVAARVVATAPCPVLTVRPAGDSS